MGLMDMVNPDIPLYMGKASKEILKRLNNQDPEVSCGIGGTNPYL